MLKEKKKLEDLEKIRMAKLREQKFEERKKAIKLSLKEIINGSDNLNNTKNKLSIKDVNEEKRKENNLVNDENNESKDE